jgi:hypothetical protein
VRLMSPITEYVRQFHARMSRRITQKLCDGIFKSAAPVSKRKAHRKKLTHSS